MAKNKIKKIANNLLVSLLLAILFNSCISELDMNLPEYKPQLVVNSFFNPDSLFLVNVSSSIGTSSKANIQKTENAIVEIYQDEQLLELLTNTGKGIYKSTNNYPKAGKEYRIKVSAVGFTTVSATSFIPEPVPIQSFTFKDSIKGDNLGGFHGELTLNFNDPSNNTNYYYLEAFLMDTSITIKEPLFISSSDPAKDQNYFNFSGILIADKLINGNSYALSLTIDSLPPTQQGKYNYIVNFQSVSKEYFMYKKTASLQSINQYNPFAEPVRVYNNIESGLGIFAGFSSVKLKIK